MEPILKVDHLVQQVGKKTVLQNISFTVNAGECFGVYGPRGSGKTTLLHILAGLDKFKSGSVEMLGYNIRKTESFKKQLGLVTQHPSLFQDLTVLENLDFIAALKNVKKSAIPPLIQQFALEQFLREPAGSLEGGICQRVSLACALLNQPKVLILDAVIRDIDRPSRRMILQRLTEYLAGGGCCICSLPDLHLAEPLTRVGWLENGQMTIFQPRAAREQWQCGEADV